MKTCIDNNEIREKLQRQILLVFFWWFINIHGYNVSTTYAARRNQLNASRTNWITGFVYEEANISSRPR